MSPQLSEAFARADLTAQTNMAIAAWLQVTIALLAALLLWRTLRATRDAVKEAREATDAARAAVEVSRTAAHNQLRAYVGGNSFNYFYNSETEMFGVSGEIKNHGQTPAYDFRFQSGLFCRDYPVGSVPSLDPPNAGTHTLYPGMSTFASLALPCTSEHVRRLNEGSLCFLFVIQVAYRDHEGVEHRGVQRVYFGGNSVGRPLQANTNGTMTFYTDTIALSSPPETDEPGPPNT